MELGKEFLESELRELESRARQARDDIAALVVEAKSRDGLIQLSVGSQGRLRELTFDPRVKRLDVQDLAARIVEMMNEAQDLLEQETASKLGAVFPDFPSGDPFGDGGPP